jgi:hypothetical protein
MTAKSVIKMKPKKTCHICSAVFLLKLINDYIYIYTAYDVLSNVTSSLEGPCRTNRKTNKGDVV